MKMLLLVLLSAIFYGAPAQEVNLLKLEDLYKRVNAGKDSIYVINFWATWCVPCLEELPYFEKLYFNHKQQKLKVLLVSMDFRSKMQNTVIPFVRKNGLKNEVYLLDESNQQEFIERIDPAWSGALPATLIYYKDKRRFFEKEFTYPDLLTEFQNIQKP
jgi:thiol-disulfide isomerase/thioredoxin